MKQGVQSFIAVLAQWKWQTINCYCSDPKFSDRQALANSANSDQTAPSLEEQSDQGLHCLPFSADLLDTFLYGNTFVFEF